MSEISHHQAEKALILHQLFYAILHKNDALQQIRVSRSAIENATAHDVIGLVDKLMQENIPLTDLKIGINKFLNVLGNTIKKLPDAQAMPESFVGLLQQNNNILLSKLTLFKETAKELNAAPANRFLWTKAAEALAGIAAYEAYYVIKENVLFPLIEKHWPNFRCTQLMWSFQDEIRDSLNQLRAITQTSQPELAAFNKNLGKLYFNMMAIRLRDEKLLFPHLLATISTAELDILLQDCHDPELPYVKAPLITTQNTTAAASAEGLVDLLTGSLSANQLLLLFNNLPVDITFVDEFDKVRFFSSPPHRIFPRSRAIIGRDVHQCHPPESVHIVQRIVEGFKSGKKDSASFWINMKEKKILIRYFALRDNNRSYKGVIEVSQEVSGIQNLSGEQRLLDWTDDNI